MPLSIGSFSVSLHFMSNLFIGLVYGIALPTRKIQGPKEDHVLQTERRHYSSIRAAPAEGPGPSAGGEAVVPSANADPRRQKLQVEIDRIDTWLNVAADNGLFKRQTAVPYTNIQRILHLARRNLDNNLLSDCETNISCAIHAYSEALYSTCKLWRFLNIYAAHIWIYLAAFLSIVLAFYLYFIDTYLENSAHIAQAAIHATTWGVIGSILRGMWFLKEKVGDRQYRNSWTIYFISVPFLGGIFGAIIYLVIIAGLLSFNGNMANPNTPANPIVIIPIAAFAGFNWEWAVAIFKRIGDLLSPTGPRTEDKVP
jgi:hypothetical protein